MWKNHQILSSLRALSPSLLHPSTEIAGRSLALALILLMSVLPVSYGSRLRAAPGDMDKVGVQREYVEWSLTSSLYEGNPFDVIATVTFTHGASGEKRTTQMFYDGGDTWKFRFTGTRTGTWTFTTSSSNAHLNGHGGQVTVNPNPDPNAYGFVTNIGNKWAREKGNEGSVEAFVPQLVMLGTNIGVKLIDYYNNPALPDHLIGEFIENHGFTGFHTGVIGGQWFDIETTDATVSSSMTNPDPRSFEALESLITKVHQAGGVIHIWAWGDHDRRMTPRSLAGGINGIEDRRLQRYIAARLGSLPGWTMGYGFDLWEWSNGTQHAAWHKHMHDHMGWKHYLGARWEKNKLTQSTEAMDYSGYEWHKPTYVDYVDLISARPQKPAFAEDRFRVRGTQSKDYSLEETRRGLYHSTMAGGVANIWGNLGSSNNSQPYPNKDQIKTYSRFFESRFLNDMTRCNTLTDGVCLKNQANTHYVFYKENTSSIQMNLSGMNGSQPAIAIDTTKKYQEINLGTLSVNNQAWTAPYSSDWAIAVGEFGAPSTSPTSTPTSTPTKTPTPTQIVTATPTGTPTPLLNQCQIDFESSEIIDVQDIIAVASQPACQVYLPLIIGHWREPWSVLTEELITEVEADSQHSYEIARLAVAEPVYVDRNYTFSSLPTQYQGSEFIRTANNDKSATSADFLSFTLTADATVYIAYDDRATELPAWLADGWTLTGDLIQTTDTPRRVYEKEFVAGAVTLGGNAMAPMAGARSNYTVIAVPAIDAP